MLIRPKSISPQKGAKCLLCGNVLDGIATCIGICPSCVRDDPDKGRDRIELVHAESREMFGLPTRAASQSGRNRMQTLFSAMQAGTEPERVLRGKAAGVNRACEPMAAHALLFPITTILCRRTVLPTGSAPAAQARAIPVSPTIAVLKSVSTIWPFSLKPATSIASIAKTGPLRKPSLSPRWSNIETLEKAVTDTTSCICFFGGDPGPQLPFAFASAGSFERKTLTEFFESAGRPTALRTLPG